MIEAPEIRLKNPEAPFTAQAYSAIVRRMATTGLFCPHCGHMNDAQAAYCAKCGTAQPTGPAQTPVAGTPAVAAAPAYGTGYSAPVTRAVGYGGFWIRLVAFIIDYMIVRVAMIPFALLFFGRLVLFGMIPRHGGYMGPDEVLPVVGAAMKLVLVQVVIFWLYEALMTSSNKQATLGKMVFGLKITDTQGQRISFARASGRHFGKYLSFLIMCIGFIIAAFTPRKQALHDMMADTLVLKTQA